MISFTNGKNITNRRKLLSSTRKPLSIKICGSTLVRILDMVCNRARQLLMKKQRSSLHEKRQMIINDDPFTRTLRIKDHARQLILFFK
jgi:predicted metalloprotease